MSLLVEHGIGVEKTEARILRLDPSSLVSESDIEADPSNADTEPTTPTDVAEHRRGASRARRGKNRSLWPLPGGQANFVQTMWRLLTEVSESEPTLDQFVEWMLGTFERVNSRKTARSYIEMVRLAGLIVPRSGRFVLTADGAAALADTDADADALYRVMEANIDGLAEALTRSRQSPVTAEMLRSRTARTRWSPAQLPFDRRPARVARTSCTASSIAAASSRRSSVPF